MTRVKICGIRSLADLQIANRAGADAIGLLCSVPVDSPREIAVERAASIAEEAPPFLTTVLVTMPGCEHELEAVINNVDPDVVQLHGECSLDRLRAISDRIPTIRALSVQATDEIAVASEIADAILLDSTDASGAGGTGNTTDWNQARAIVNALDTPVVLAGGLTPANVGRAVETVRPYAVDVASGVDGVAGKDAAKVNAFIAAATGELEESPPP